MNPFRSGVQPSGAPSGSARRGSARSVGDLGCPTLFIPDHVEERSGPPVAAPAGT